MADFVAPYTTPALLVLLLAGSVLVVLNDWRVGLAALLLEYVSAAALLTQLVIPEVALVKLTAGVLVVLILTLTAGRLNLGRPGSAGPAGWQARLQVPTAFPFRLTAVIMVVVSALFLSNQSQWVLPGLNQAPTINTASYVLMGLGLLNLGLTEEPIAAGMGLLTLLLGFEIFYSAVEPSLAVVGLIAAVELAIALAASYLATLQHGEFAGSDS